MPGYVRVWSAWAGSVGLEKVTTTTTTTAAAARSKHASQPASEKNGIGEDEKDRRERDDDVGLARDVHIVGYGYLEE